MNYSILITFIIPLNFSLLFKIMITKSGSALKPTRHYDKSL